MRVLTWAEWGEMTNGLLGPTDDDVSITNDGRRLDTAQKVFDFFAELDAEREGSPGWWCPTPRRRGRVGTTPPKAPAPPPGRRSG